MSEATICIWIIGFVVLTLNVAVICDTMVKIEQIRKGITTGDTHHVCNGYTNDAQSNLDLTDKGAEFGN